MWYLVRFKTDTTDADVASPLQSVHIILDRGMSIYMLISIIIVKTKNIELINIFRYKNKVQGPYS